MMIKIVQKYDHDKNNIHNKNTGCDNNDNNNDNNTDTIMIMITAMIKAMTMMIMTP